MESLAYLNGTFIPEGGLQLSFADAGFVYGATVTDFCRTYRHRLFRWPDHLARLRRDAATCHIPLIQSDAELTAAAEHLIATQSEGLAEADDLALITFATPGPLGYMTGSAENGPPTLGMHCFPIPKERYRRFFTEGVELQIAGSMGSENHIVKPSVKHRSRMEWWMASKLMENERVAMAYNHNGVDTALGAIVTVMGGTVTASPPSDVLDSVSLKVVEELCRELGLKFARVASPYWILTGPRVPAEHYAMLDSVSEMMLAGSAIGLAGVKGLFAMGNHREYPCPGPVTQKLQAAWSRLVGVDIVEQMLK